jgi:hypothetical protein
MCLARRPFFAFTLAAEFVPQGVAQAVEMEPQAPEQPDASTQTEPSPALTQSASEEQTAQLYELLSHDVPPVIFVSQ